MYYMMAVANQEIVPEVAHGEAVARLTSSVAAMAALDRQIERCTDPRAESCLLALRVEHEVAYLETLYGWAYKTERAAVIQ
jgi:hypothetical protein